MTIHGLECACCMGDGGTFQQFDNQDYEYGVCTSCAVWIADREGWPSVFSTYGVPGRNWRPPTENSFGDAQYTSYEDFKTKYFERYGVEFTGKVMEGCY